MSSHQMRFNRALPPGRESGHGSGMRVGERFKWLWSRLGDLSLAREIGGWLWTLAGLKFVGAAALGAVTALLAHTEKFPWSVAMVLGMVMLAATLATLNAVMGRRRVGGAPSPGAKEPRLCEITLEAHVDKDGVPAKRRGTAFRVVVRATAALHHLAIYVDQYEMRSGWSDTTVTWYKTGDRAKVDEVDRLRAGEERFTGIGLRLFELTSPLYVAGQNHIRDNPDIWPYLRVDITVISDEGSATEQYAILAPGYPYSGVRRLADVPMSEDAFA